MIHKMLNGMWIDVAKISALDYNFHGLSIYLDFKDKPLHISDFQFCRQFLEYKNNEIENGNTDEWMIEQAFIKLVFDDLFNKWVECYNIIKSNR